MGNAMFTSVSSRSALAYRQVSVETSVAMASPHQLVNMLFEGLLVAIGAARIGLAKRDMVVKGENIMKAVRYIDEGLKPALNLKQGGALAENLDKLYEYCLLRLTQANLHNDDAALNEVAQVIEPLAQGWREIKSKVGA